MSSMLSQLSAICAMGDALRKAESDKKKEQFTRCASRAHEEHKRKAFERYRAVMQGQGWLTQWEIEQRLGYSRTTAGAFIQRLYKDYKVIERRNRDGEEKFNRQRGYEWRWKE